MFQLNIKFNLFVKICCIIIDPDLYKQKQEELQKARIKFQEEYEKKAKIALEKQKEVNL